MNGWLHNDETHELERKLKLMFAAVHEIVDINHVLLVRCDGYRRGIDLYEVGKGFPGWVFNVPEGTSPEEAYSSLTVGILSLAVDRFRTEAQEVLTRKINTLRKVLEASE